MPNTNTGPDHPTTPSKHPSSEGLENAIASVVEKEFEKRGVQGGGGDGGGDDTDTRLRSLETEVAIIKETMVTKEIFAREMGDFKAEMSKDVESLKAEFNKEMGALKTEFNKMPFEVFKWFLGTVLAILMAVLAIVKLLPPV